MEKKQRVPKGEKYWYITSDFFAGDFYITSGVDFYEDMQDGRFAIGNYFHTKEEAEAMACKLRAIFNGADVIERWESKEVLNTLQVALSTEYGLTGLDSQREIDEKIAKTSETCLMRMLKKSIEIMSKIVK